MAERTSERERIVSLAILATGTHASVTGCCESCSVELMRRLREPATLSSLPSLTCSGSGRSKAVRLAGRSLS